MLNERQIERRKKVLADYKTMYYQLAAKIADAIELLTAAQQEGEDLFIEFNAQSEICFLHKEAQEEHADKDSQ